LVSFSNYGVSSLWQTYDGGQTWLEKEGNLPDMPIRWVMYHPLNSGQVMAATETGIWITNQMHEPEPVWEPATQGMGNVRVDMLQYRDSDQTVLAASHGRGLFTTIWEKDVYTGIKETTKNRDLKLFPNPVTDRLNISGLPTTDKSVTYSVYDIKGALVDQSVLRSTEKTETSIVVGHLKSGHYIIRFDFATQSYESWFIKK